MKVEKLMGLLYKLNRFLSETILTTSYTSLIKLFIHIYDIVWKHGMEHIKIIPPEKKKYVQ